MRVKEAVPDLLKLVRRHEFNSSLFIIARAIAKCSRGEQDVKELLRCLLTHNKSFTDLVVDIIEEAPIDQTVLFAELIHEDHPFFIRIGLNGLKEYTNPRTASAVFRLTDSKDEDIQKKAIEIYLKSSTFLPKHAVKQWMEHPNADIRLMTVQALSELKNPAYQDDIQSCLKDQDLRVVYAGSMGLLQLGEEGMLLFCETARDFRDKGQGTVLQEIIEEELKVLSARLNHVENLVRYNVLMYFYEKSFGKNKRMYRVV